MCGIQVACENRNDGDLCKSKICEFQILRPSSCTPAASGFSSSRRSSRCRIRNFKPSASKFKKMVHLSAETIKQIAVDSTKHTMQLLSRNSVPMIFPPKSELRDSLQSEIENVLKKFFAENAAPEENGGNKDEKKLEALESSVKVMGNMLVNVLKEVRETKQNGVESLGILKNFEESAKEEPQPQFVESYEDQWSEAWEEPRPPEASIPAQQGETTKPPKKRRKTFPVPDRSELIQSFHSVQRPWPNASNAKSAADLSLARIYYAQTRPERCFSVALSNTTTTRGSIIYVDDMGYDYILDNSKKNP